MKSRMIMVMALLLVFSAGLVQPLHAAECVVVQTHELDLAVRGLEGPGTDDGPGDSGETQGDPDGWLGGQNFRPSPPISSDDLAQAPSGTGGILATFYYALLKLFLIL